MLHDLDNGIDDYLRGVERDPVPACGCDDVTPLSRVLRQRQVLAARRRSCAAVDESESPAGCRDPRSLRLQHLCCALADMLDLTSERLEELRTRPHLSQHAARLWRQLPDRRQDHFIVATKRFRG